MSEPLMITMRDLRAAKMCSSGARAFFQRHGLSFSDFLQGGIPAADLEATGDAMAIKVCEVARESR